MSFDQFVATHPELKDEPMDVQMTFYREYLEQLEDSDVELN